MTESEPGWPGLGTQAGDDPLAARLLTARRALNARDIDAEVRTRLHLRFTAICASLKLPAANRARGAQRLDQLIADAELARRGTCAASARPAGMQDASGRTSQTDQTDQAGRTARNHPPSCWEREP